MDLRATVGLPFVCCAALLSAASTACCGPMQCLVPTVGAAYPGFMTPIEFRRLSEIGE